MTMASHTSSQATDEGEGLVEREEVEPSVMLPSDSDDDDPEGEYGSCTYRLDAEERQTIRNKGFVVREGQWTGLEDQQLKENMKTICEKYGIDEPRKVIFPAEYPDGKELKKLIEEKEVHKKLRRGIQRPVYNVYIRARKIFDPLNYMGRFTEAEVTQMQVLANQMGTKWSKIGREMGRSGRSLCDRFKITKDGTVSGGWSEEERDRLVSVVMAVTGFNQDRNVEKLYFKIPWTTVSDKMRTRNVTQCRTEWINIVSWAVTDYQTRYTARGRWKLEDNMRLIERIYKLDIHDEQDIDWLSLLDHFPRSPSPQKLQSHWHNLKSRYVYNHRFKSFEDIICHLHDRTLPELREKLAKRGLGVQSTEFVEEDTDQQVIIDRSGRAERLEEEEEEEEEQEEQDAMSQGERGPKRTSAWEDEDSDEDSEEDAHADIINNDRLERECRGEIMQESRLKTSRKKKKLKEKHNESANADSTSEDNVHDHEQEESEDHSRQSVEGESNDSTVKHKHKKKKKKKDRIV